tara:strand:+ start:503 stop:2737 length:2235 start_codon:yes stop_codon:yes gene_type:complete
MALGDGGLDAQVEQRMDAYRGNPQKLQQRYGANKELLDLLALQKLTSEKKAVAADMQMKMQQQPGTIAQQREQEALQLTKQEMSGTLGELAGRTKGTLDQKQRMQQQNMQRMAKAQPRKPAGIAGLPGLAGMRPQPRRVPPPQAQGLAGARMAQAAAQGGPKRMAGGGIVSFAEGETVSSPFRRSFNALVDRIGEDMALQQLRQRVKTKYGLFASPVGGLRSQSDEQRTYAKNVLDVADTLDENQLLALADADFQSGMSTTEISALPALPLSDTSEEVTEDTITDTSQTDALDPTSEQQPPTTGDVTFLPAEQEDFFKDLTTSYEPVKPEEADKSALETSITAMTDQAGKTPTMGDVTPLEAAPLEAVAAPYTESEQKLSDELTERYVADSNTGVAGALRGARADSDVYFDREGKAKTYAQQEADERALQAETLDPDRLKKLARMQTLAGGRRGAGGIGQAYVDAQLGQDKRRSAGLTTLRGIQDTGILSDTNIATYGATAGQNAAQRAEARRVSGMSGLQGLLNQAQERALQGQREQNAINSLNKQFEQDVAKGDFNAAREALNRQSNALREVVKMNVNDVNNQVNRNLSISEDENKALAVEVETALEVAKAKSEERLELNKELFNNEVELMKLAEARAATVAESVTEAMNKNPLAMQLQAKLRSLAGSENEVEFRETEAQLEAIERATIARLATILTGFADAYTDMITLNKRIQQIRAANTALSSTTSRLNPEDVNMETVQQ